MKDYFSEDFANLIEALTNKNPKMRLGHPSRGGVSQIKRQKFFKKIDWEAVLNKEMKPPIIPVKRKGVLDVKSGDSNPYVLLDQNFDRKTVMEAVYLYD